MILETNMYWYNLFVYNCSTFFPMKMNDFTIIATCFLSAGTEVWSSPVSHCQLPPGLSVLLSSIITMCSYVPPIITDWKCVCLYMRHSC